MNEELIAEISVLIDYVQKRRFSSHGNMWFASTKTALEKHRGDIQKFGGDVYDYYQRTGNLPGTPPKRRSHAYNAVIALIEGKPLEEVKTELIQKVIL